jgi:peptide/nickel transport system permease protein
MRKILDSFREFLKYPSVIVSLVMILCLIGISVYALVVYPYAEATRLWRGGEEVWYMNPRQVPPAWFNLFTAKKRPVSFVLKTTNLESVTKEVKLDTQGGSKTVMTYSFDYAYDELPQEIILYFTSTYQQKQPYAEVIWITPDQRKIRLTNLALISKETYRFSQDTRLVRLLKGKPVMDGLFLDPKTETAQPATGTYQVVVTAFTFEKDSTVDAELVMHGQLYGLAGTDHLRRDLMIALLWGTPIALAFGLLAALGTTLTTILIAAIGAWFGGWLEELIQRITEINLVLPFLPILLMIGSLYSRSIWLILGATILLNIFGPGIKTYRAVFLQIMQSPYIEAARSYGASDIRIIFKYMVPRVIPTLVPQLVSLIPTYVFLEATLAVLGLGDPILPTWGKLINDAFTNSALYDGLYYWVMEPAALLMTTGLAFALLGFALDRVFNPRLREI